MATAPAPAAPAAPAVPDVTIYKRADIKVTLIDGDPPADQTAQVADLQAQLAALKTQLDAATGAQQGTAAQLATVTGERDSLKSKLNTISSSVAALVAALQA